MDDAGDAEASDFDSESLINVSGEGLAKFLQGFDLTDNLRA